MGSLKPSHRMFKRPELWSHNLFAKLNTPKSMDTIPRWGGGITFLRSYSPLGGTSSRIYIPHGGNDKWKYLFQNKYPCVGRAQVGAVTDSPMGIPMRNVIGVQGILKIKIYGYYTNRGPTLMRYNFGYRVSLI